MCQERRLRKVPSFTYRQRLAGQANVKPIPVSDQLFDTSCLGHVIPGHVMGRHGTPCLDRVEHVMMLHHMSCYVMFLYSIAFPYRIMS